MRIIVLLSLIFTFIISCCKEENNIASEQSNEALVYISVYYGHFTEIGESRTTYSSTATVTYGTQSISIRNFTSREIFVKVGTVLKARYYKTISWGYNYKQSQTYSEEKQMMASIDTEWIL